jgi:hypothetical protein
MDKTLQDRLESMPVFGECTGYFSSALTVRASNDRRM